MAINTEEDIELRDVNVPSTGRPFETELAQPMTTRALLTDTEDVSPPPKWDGDASLSNSLKMKEQKSVKFQSANHEGRQV